MEIDPFMLDAGLCDGAAPADEKALTAALLAAAETFFRAGGVLDWSYWRTLTSASRAALITARQSVEDERAARTATILAAGVGAALQATKQSLDDAALDKIVSDAADGAAKRIAEKVPG